MIENQELLLFFETYEQMRDSAKGTFSRIANRLLNETFLIKSKIKDRDDYFLLLANFSLYKTYFSLIDYDVILDESKAIIYLMTAADRNRIRLSKLETVIALLLRIHYYKQNKEILSIDQVVMSFEELQDEVNKTQIFKTQKRLSEYDTALKKLKTFKLIDYSKSIINSEMIFEIFPTIMIVINQEEIEEMQNRLKSFMESGDEFEDTDEDQTD